jgi:hypothetical protein
LASLITITFISLLIQFNAMYWTIVPGAIHFFVVNRGSG